MTEAMTDAPTEPMPATALFELLSLECRVNSYGTTTYHNSNGQLHRIHGPAVVYSDGSKFWYQNGQRHRLGGPAIEYADGSNMWCQNGRLHRIDGPAGEFPGGYREWYINGKELTKAEWQQAVASMENV